MDLAAAVDQLYGAAPEEFVTARKRIAAQARQEGDRMLATRVLALRKPTLPAWAINATVRSQAPELGEFIEFAEAMRDAQSALDGPAMRELSREREPLLTAVAEVVSAAAADGGQRLTPPVLAEVRATFVAAIADPAAQEAVLSGCLTRALAYAGLGEVDLTQATATPSRPRGQEALEQPPPPGEPDPIDASPTGTPPQPRPARDPQPEPPIPDVRDGSPAAQTQARAQTPAPAQSSAQTPAPAQSSAQTPAPSRSSVQSRARDEGDARAADRRAAARRRLLDRAHDRLTEAEREVTARSLAQAQAREQAQRATARAAELERLLRRATQEAQTAQEAEQAADTALTDATASRDDARAELAALED